MNVGMSDDSAPSTIASLVKTIGGWTTPSGRGIFMFNMITTNVSAAALSGVASAYLTGLLIGPVAAVGFAIGSSVGWVGSTLYYWHTTQCSALQAFEAYPQLMMLHLIRNYRTLGFDKVPMVTEEDRLRFRRRIDGELGLRCLLMSAWCTARGSIDEIEDRKEQHLIEQLCSKEEV